jgi:hypothetical protein
LVAGQVLSVFRLGIGARYRSLPKAQSLRAFDRKLHAQ